jgi:lipoprotein-anchoring transpeptidase ErfK/SrfK
MNDRFVESRKALSYAREALKNGKTAEARQWAERAAELAPQSEDPWLILATVASPRESVGYIRKALEANPNSPRAKKGMEWAMQRLGKTPKGRVSAGNGKQAQGPLRSEDTKNPKKRNRILPILLIMMGCAMFMFAAWSAMTSPVLASILNASLAPQTQPTHAQSFAQVNIAKPSAMQPIAQVVLPTVTPASIPTVPATQETQPEVVSVLPTNPPTIEVVVLLTDAPFVEPAAAASVPEVTSEPGTVFAEIIADTPTPEYTAPTAAPYVPAQVAGNGGEHWIDVDLSQQRVYAYEGDTVVNSFIVSTGTWQTPTVTGKFKVWIKVRSQAMSGPGYYLPDVPYVMYFYKDYGLHGTYWHNNFGTPMSHGCVNLTIPDAEWLYNFSVVGTVVNVHY